ncbi:MAG: hypothetical protein HWE33_17365 [Rhodobacteraceae bacterium]|nr:hypothetical protein [Paracoccaceae bacterium]
MIRIAPQNPKLMTVGLYLISLLSLANYAFHGLGLTVLSDARLMFLKDLFFASDAAILRDHQPLDHWVLPYTEYLTVLFGFAILVIFLTFFLFLRAIAFGVLSFIVPKVSARSAEETKIILALLTGTTICFALHFVLPIPRVSGHDFRIGGGSYWFAAGLSTILWWGMGAVAFIATFFPRFLGHPNERTSFHAN